MPAAPAAGRRRAPPSRIDVAKHSPDVHVLPGGQHFSLPNTPDGHAGRRLPLAPARVVLEQDIQARIDARDDLRRHQQELLTVARAGPAVSRVLVAERPGLGTRHRRKLASLVGLRRARSSRVAPFNDDSGRHAGRRAIRGGRHTVRAAPYMATLVGVRHDPHLKAHYRQLLARGKPEKVALVACTNKRLCHLNSVLREEKTVDT